jgi:hypothetical protein
MNQWHEMKVEVQSFHMHLRIIDYYWYMSAAEYASAQCSTLDSRWLSGQERNQIFSTSIWAQRDLSLAYREGFNKPPALKFVIQLRETYVITSEIR